jgi:pyroglutamyl-peptidase
MSSTADKIILLTGFEAFGGFGSNPTALLAERLAGSRFGDYRVETCVLPVVFGQASHLLAEQLNRWHPAVVVCLGQAAGRSGITPERIAVNIDDADIPDNAGYQPQEQAIVAHGPVAYWSTLPVRKIRDALADLEIPAAISMSAGTYVCNHVFYHLMHLLAGKPAVTGGVIHIPLMDGQATDGRPSLPLAQIEQGIRCVLATIVAELAGKQPVS